MKANEGAADVCLHNICMYDVCLYRSTGDYHRAQICGKIDCQLPTSWAGKTGGGGPSLNRREEHYWRNRGRQFLQGSNAPQEVGADHHLLNTSHAPRVGRRSVQGQ